MILPRRVIAMHITEADRASIVEWATQHGEIVEVWLFGSRARGDHGDDSDIDLAIVIKRQDLNARFARWPDRPEVWATALRLSHSPNLQWYDPDARLVIGPGVRRDRVLLYRASVGEGQR
jgi:predicted nucleotidyltransferase